MAWLASSKISWYCVDHHLQLSCPQTPSISCCPQISGQPSANCLIFRQTVPVANVFISHFPLSLSFIYSCLTPSTA